MPSQYSWNSIDIELEVLGADNLPQHCNDHMIHRLAAQHILRIEVNDIKIGEWPLGSELLNMSDKDQRLKCTINKTCIISLKIDCEHKHLHSSHTIATVQGKAVDNMFHYNAVTEIPLPHPTHGTASPIRLSLKISHIMTAEQLSQVAMVNASGTSRSHYTIDDLKSMGLISRLIEKDLEVECPQWINLLGALARFTQIAQGFSELDPKAKAVVTVVSAAFELFLAQRERDERIVRLVEIMSHLYQMILDSEPLEKCKTLKDAIERLINLTRECAYFISDYMNQGAFTKRMLMSSTNISSPIDDCISQYEKSFTLFKESFFTGIVLDVARTNVRIWERLQNIDEKIDEMQLQLYKSTIASHFPIVYGRPWDSSLAFIPRYRMSILNEICSWGGSINSTYGAFLLSGAHKGDKTSVARLVADHFRDQNRLGSAIFIDNDIEKFTEVELVSTLIRDLSIYDDRLAKKIASYIGNNPRISKHYLGAPDAWFQHLVLEPLYNTPFIGTTMIIIDGISDVICERSSFIELLLRFPPSIRLFLTSSYDNVADKVGRKFGSKIDIRKMTSDDSKTLLWDADSYIFGYLEILETLQPMLFSKHPLVTTKAGISSACKGVYSLAYICCKVIALLPMDGALYFIDILSNSSTTEINIDECLAPLLAGYHFLATATTLLGLWPFTYSKATEELIMQGFLHTDDLSTHAIFTNMYIELLLDAIIKHNSQKLEGAQTRNHTLFIPSPCWNAAAVFQFLEIMELPNHVIIRDQMMTHHKLCSQCSKVPQLLVVLFEVAAGQYTGNLNVKVLQDAVISTDQPILSLDRVYRVNFEGSSSRNDFSSSHVYMLSKPLKFSTIFGKISAVRLTVTSSDQGHTAGPPPFNGPYHRSRTWFEASIYRRTSNDGQKQLSKIERTLEDENRRVTKDSMMSLSGVEVVRHPLTGRETWELQRNARACGTPRKHSILWFNIPVELVDNKKNDDSPDGHGEGRGVGFVNSLQPDDRIVIVACTNGSKWVNCVYSASIEVLYAEYPEDELNLHHRVYDHCLSMSIAEKYSEIPEQF